MTVDKSKMFGDVFTQLKRLAEDYFEAFYGGLPDEVSITDVTETTMSVSYVVRRYRGYEEDEFYGFDIPLKYLWTENWKDIVRAELEASNEKAKQERVILAQKQQEAIEEYDRKQYEKLKLRFNNV